MYWLFLRHQNLPMSNNNTCSTCGQPLRGRTDKKFCNDYCRNIHHNSAQPRLPEDVKKINRILTNNRKLLDSLLVNPNYPIRISRQYLLECGFHFNYFTHTIQNYAVQYKFCYDLAFFEINERELLLWKNNP